MMKFVILFALVAAAAAKPSPPLNVLSPTSRIVGGEATTIDEVPYIVSIQVFRLHRCGGSIISDRWILTAASCYTFSPSWYNVRSGSTIFNEGGTLSTDVSFIVHEEYSNLNFGIPTNDIALVLLSSPLTFGSTQSRIALHAADQVSAVGSAAVIAGWGPLREHGWNSETLHTVTVPIISQADCDVAYANWGGLRVNQICGGFGQGGRSTCDGDTGSPVTIGGVVAGIVSWSNGCARPGFPGIYTQVSAYRAWITANSGE